MARLTRAKTAPELVAALAEEWRRFGGEANRPLRRGMREWTQEMMLGLGDSAVEPPSFEELEGSMEEGTMEYLLEDHIREWRAELHGEGFKEGIEQGIAQGMERGIAQGRERGKRDLLERLAERRFGAAAARRLSAALNGAASPQRLDELGDLVVLCRTADELVERLGG